MLLEKVLEKILYRGVVIFFSLMNIFMCYKNVALNKAAFILIAETIILDALKRTINYCYNKKIENKEDISLKKDILTTKSNAILVTIWIITYFVAILFSK